MGVGVAARTVAEYLLLMLYFTRGWANGELDEEAADRVAASYQENLRRLLPRMPPTMVQLASCINLHDALIERVRWSPVLKELEMRLVAGTNQEGYKAVVLTYRGAMLGRQRLQALREVARDREACVLYDEVDVQRDGTLAHRYLFWPRAELTIEFAELDLQLIDLEDRRVDLGPAFIEEHSDG